MRKGTAAAAVGAGGEVLAAFAVSFLAFVLILVVIATIVPVTTTAILVWLGAAVYGVDFLLIRLGLLIYVHRSYQGLYLGA